MKKVEGNIIDINNRRIFPGVITLNEEGLISSIDENDQKYDHYILPGFIDAHVHIESSMLIPEEFSKLAIRKGTVAIVTDPHEIANVLGMEGIYFMMENNRFSDIKMFFTIPSCVPSTPFDSSGSCLSASDVKELLQTDRFIGLSEMMNVPGVIHEDPEVMQKIAFTRQKGLIIDGHAPGLKGEELRKYVEAGITTDHECVTLEEALEKIRAGMKILIREGSAAKNFEALKPLITLYPENVMFCTDDSHPGDLIQDGHIDKMVKRAIAEGFDLFDVLRIVCINPALHYKLNVGLLKKGDAADFILVKDLKTFDVISVYIAGKEKYNMNGNMDFPRERANIVYPNLFQREKIGISELVKPVKDRLICIQVMNHEIITGKVVFPLSRPLANLESDISRDILKIVYLNRYHHNSPQIAFIHGIGLKRGAFASSISHDSHNIIAVGTNDEELTKAINKVIDEKGGLAVVDGKRMMSLPLPIAGIITQRKGEEVAQVWESLINLLKEMGCCLESPFMTLSFMALIVIPELKIGEKGLFEYSRFNFISG